MTAYYRVMAGKKSRHATACFEGGFIGTDFGITEWEREYGGAVIKVASWIQQIHDTTAYEG